MTTSTVEVQGAIDMERHHTNEALKAILFKFHEKKEDKINEMATYVIQQRLTAEKRERERNKILIQNQIKALEDNQMGHGYYLEGLKMAIHLIFLSEPEEAITNITKDQ